MSRVLMIAGLVGASAGFLIFGSEFAERHSLVEQIAVGLLAILMLCTLFGMKITTILGFLFRMIVIALIWRCLASVLRIARLR
ncbi:hypothetical protein [Falsirhodobacter deserti]|uniref:hypothetical protein n=1 Tax=Falsirhodobacter deserti TaxID=1365611 RepID=UPI000FE4209B|nr:hypothetical protein [Falsirhodobacter deserti]